MSESKDINQLMREAIEAAREGKKSEAKALFQEVVDLDDKNEKAWIWLASVVDTDEERRVCLSNVLFINPGNEKAQAAMAKLDAKAKKTQDEEEVIPGVNRRQLLMIGGGGAAAVLLILVIFIALSSGRASQDAAETAAAAAVYATGTAVVQAATDESTNATATQLAFATEIPSATPEIRNTLPPTIDLSVQQATVAPTSTPLPYPSNLTGRIAGWSGRDLNNTGYLPIVIYPLDQANTQPVAIGDSKGRDPVFSPDGLRLMYTRFFSATTQDTGLEQIGVDAGTPINVTSEINVTKAQMPNYCTSQPQIAFVGLPPESSGSLTSTVFPIQVFALNLDSRQLSRLTNDRASYTYPAFSPDCSKVAVIRTELEGVNQGADLVLIDTATLAQTPLTSDRDNFVESTPRWSADGTQLTYSAHPGSDPNNSDIIVRRADPSSTPIVVVRDAGNDILPVFSPDGKYVAFSSKRGDQYDVYVLDQETQVTYQLTNSGDDDYISAWVP
ncbi:MAG: hypothetical protein R3E39_16620 [Anaerolineae bacterium]